MSNERRMTIICICAMLGFLHFQLARSAQDTECNRLLNLHLPKVRRLPYLPCSELQDATTIKQAAQVALMFLVRTDSHHIGIWTKWLAQLENKVPSTLACSSSAMHCFRHQSTLLATTNAVYSQQHFFSIYVHTRPEAPDFPPDHLFHGRVITDRVSVGSSCVASRVFSDYDGCCTADGLGGAFLGNGSQAAPHCSLTR